MTRAVATGGRVYAGLVVAATVSFAGALLLWAFLAPAFRAPDEHTHFSSILRLEYGGGWPTPGEAMLPPGVETAMDESRLLYKLPRSETSWGNPPRWFIEAEPPAQFSVIDETNGLPDATSTQVDQMSQHPPLSYAIQAGLARLAGMPGEPWPVQLLFARLVDVAISLPLPWLIASAARRIGVDPVTAGAAAFLPVAIPQVAHIMASATSDTWVVMVCSVWAWLLAARWREGYRWRDLVIIGAVLGVGLFMKATALMAIVPTAAAIAASPALRSWSQRALRPLVALTTAFVVGGWWYALNLLQTGKIMPSGLSISGEVTQDPARTVWAYVPRTLVMFTDSFVGKFSYLELTLTSTGGRVGVLLLLVLIAVALWRAGRDTWLIGSLVGVPASFVVVAEFSNWHWYRDFGLLPGFQGRYLFVGLLGMALAVAVAATRLAPRARVAVSSLAIVVAGAVAALGFVVAALGFYADPSEGLGAALDRWPVWAMGGAAGAAAGAVGAVACLVGVLAGVAVAIWGRSFASSEGVRERQSS